MEVSAFGRTLCCCKVIVDTTKKKEVHQVIIEGYTSQCTQILTLDYHTYVDLTAITTLKCTAIRNISIH